MVSGVGGWIPHPAAVMGGRHRRVRRTWVGLQRCVVVPAAPAASGGVTGGFDDSHCGCGEGGADFGGVEFVGVALIAAGGVPLALPQHAGNQYPGARGEGSSAPSPARTPSARTSQSTLHMNS
jgi:hypothetical protein